jgi:hypothetical protein
MYPKAAIEFAEASSNLLRIAWLQQNWEEM